jgi:hypothetical protein
MEDEAGDKQSPTQSDEFKLNSMIKFIEKEIKPLEKENEAKLLKCFQNL